MPLIVQKYGGSSLATPKHIQRAARRIKLVKQAGHDLVVVVSAMGRMTDHLLNLARRTVKQPPQRELDMLMTAGERISMSLLAMSLQEEGVPAISFTGSQSGIVTSSDHTEARILDIRAFRIREELAKGKVVIIAGFQGVSQEKEITTLGRGGSDTTAVAVAAALGAEVCEVLTDVDGLFTADPRIVKGARLLETCSYEEALELASLGAKMQSRSIELARRFRVKVRIASSFRQESTGTSLVAGRFGKEEEMEKTSIRGVATREGYHFFRASLGLQELLPLLQGRKVPLRFFSFADEEVRFLSETDKVAAVQETLQASGRAWEETPRVAIVSAVGEGLSASPDLLPRFLEAITETGARCYLLCANSLSMTAAVPAADKDKVTQLLHARLLEG